MEFLGVAILAVLMFGLVLAFVHADSARPEPDAEEPAPQRPSTASPTPAPPPRPRLDLTAVVEGAFTCEVCGEPATIALRQPSGTHHPALCQRPACQDPQRFGDLWARATALVPIGWPYDEELWDSVPWLQAEDALVGEHFCTFCAAPATLALYRPFDVYFPLVCDSPACRAMDVLRRYLESPTVALSNVVATRQRSTPSPSVPETAEDCTVCGEPATVVMPGPGESALGVCDASACRRAVGDLWTDAAYWVAPPDEGDLPERGLLCTRCGGPAVGAEWTAGASRPRMWCADPACGGAQPRVSRDLRELLDYHLDRPETMLSPRLDACLLCGEPTAYFLMVPGEWVPRGVCHSANCLYIAHARSWWRHPSHKDGPYGRPSTGYFCMVCGGPADLEMRQRDGSVQAVCDDPACRQHPAVRYHWARAQWVARLEPSEPGRRCCVCEAPATAGLRQIGGATVDVCEARECRDRAVDQSWDPDLPRPPRPPLVPLVAQFLTREPAAWCDTCEARPAELWYTHTGDGEVQRTTMCHDCFEDNQEGWDGAVSRGFFLQLGQVHPRQRVWRARGASLTPPGDLTLTQGQGSTLVP